MGKSIQSAVAKIYGQDGEFKEESARYDAISTEDVFVKAVKDGSAISNNPQFLSQLSKESFIENFPEELYGAVSEITAYIFSMDARLRKDSQI